MSQRDVQQILPMLLVYAVIFIGAIGLSLFGFASRNPFLVGSMAAIPFLMLLLNRLDIWMVAVVMLMNSNIRPPGVFGRLELMQLLLFGLILVLVAKKIIVKESVRKQGSHWRFLLLFLGVLLLTIIVRGTGFRFLGDHRWGGMRYVGLMLAALLPFFVGYVTLTPKQWRLALVGMAMLSMLGMVADVIFIVSHGRIYQLYYFFQHGAGVASSLQAATHGEMTRYQAAGVAAMGSTLIPLLLFDWKAKNVRKFLMFFALALFLGGLSGHRLALFNSVTLAWGYGFYKAKGRRWGYLFFTGVIGVLSFSMILAYVRSLPLAFQRALAFLPLIDIDPQAAISASGTSEWRYAVWRNALHEIPKYLWVGKGYTFDQSAVEGLQLLSHSDRLMEWPRLMVAYHNGPLSLLIGMGVLGLVAGLGFLISASRRHLRLTSKEKWADPLLLRLHNVMSILYLISTLKFIFIYGDVYASLPTMFVHLAILEGLWYSNLQLASTAPDEAPVRMPSAAHKPQAPFTGMRAPLPARATARQALPIR